MRRGFILYSLLVTCCILASLIVFAGRNVGLACRSLRGQEEDWSNFQTLCSIVEAQEWLITHQYDSIFMQSHATETIISLKLAGGAQLRAGTKSAWKVKKADEGLFCETIWGKKKCRWRVTRKGKNYVFSGHTFTHN